MPNGEGRKETLSVKRGGEKGVANKKKGEMKRPLAEETVVYGSGLIRKKGKGGSRAEGRKNRIDEKHQMSRDSEAA